LGKNAAGTSGMPSWQSTRLYMIPTVVRNGIWPTTYAKGSRMWRHANGTLPRSQHRIAEFAQGTNWLGLKLHTEQVIENVDVLKQGYFTYFSRRPC
jgi:hypothetical protein